MTEQTWLSTADYVAMLEFVRKKATYRKLRLFVCNVCRHFFQDVMTDVHREAILVAERYADDLASKQEVARADRQVWKTPGARATDALRWALHGRPKVAVLEVLSTGAFPRDPKVCRYEGEPPTPPFDSALPLVVPCLIRDCFDNPFQPAETAPEWLGYQDKAVVRMAQSIYEQGSFGDLPILADLLEEAGCNSTAILSHCRESDLHMRGCWVIDLLTRRK